MLPVVVLKMALKFGDLLGKLPKKLLITILGALIVTGAFLFYGVTQYDKGYTASEEKYKEASYEALTEDLRDAREKLGDAIAARDKALSASSIAASETSKIKEDLIGYEKQIQSLKNRHMDCRVIPTDYRVLFQKIHSPK